MKPEPYEVSPFSRTQNPYRLLFLAITPSGAMKVEGCTPPINENFRIFIYETRQ
jgi:hypothetical protein